MKNITLLILFFQVYCSSQQNPIIDLQTNKLNDSVKSIQEFHLVTKASTISQTNNNVNNYKKNIDSLPTYKKYFNKKGYEIEYHKCNAGKLLGKTEYLLDPDMKKVKSTHYDYINKGFKIKKHNRSLVFLYDLKNRLSEITSSDENLTTIKKIFIYDNQNNIVEIAHEKENGTYNERVKYFYDKNRNCIKKITYKAIDNTVENIYIMRYNTHGHISDLRKLNSGGLLLNTTTYEYNYDSKNNWILRFDKNENIIESITKRNIEYYNNNGQQEQPLTQTKALPKKELINNTEITDIKKEKL